MTKNYIHEMDIKTLESMFDKSLFRNVTVHKDTAYRGYTIKGLTSMTTERSNHLEKLGFRIVVTANTTTPMFLDVYCVKIDK